MKTIRIFPTEKFLKDILQDQQGLNLIGHRVVMDDLIPVQKYLVYAKSPGPQYVNVKVITDHEALFFAGMYSAQGLVKDLRPRLVVTDNL